MDRREARALLSAHRTGETPADERVAEAEKLASEDPELRRWWREEQEFDRVIAEKLAEVPVPADLRARLISSVVPFPARKTRRRPILLAAAAIILFAGLFALWHRPLRPAGSMVDYRAEMVDLMNSKYKLGLESADLTQIHQFLAKSGAPSDFEIPKPLLDLEPLGCLELKFHGQKVALVCFRRESGNIAHLFVIKRSALRGLTSATQFATESGWMTATWTNGDKAYLLTIRGDQSTAEKYIRDS